MKRYRFGSTLVRVLIVSLAAVLVLAAGLTFSRAPAQADGGLTVNVGYADDLRSNPANFPIPWQGSPNIIFDGRGTYWDGHYDAGAIKLDNTSLGPITIQSVTVHLHPQHGGPSWSGYWSAHTLPPGSSLILTQNNGYESFDTSDNPFMPCGHPAGPTQDPPQIVITYVAGGSTNTQTFSDTGHVLDTGAYDRACQGNESLQWRQIGTADTGNTSATLTLSPATATVYTGAAANAQATLTDAAAAPLANVQVDFAVVSGPNAGSTSSATTDAQGHATFTYTSALTGTDTIRASVTTPSGTFQSNTVTVTWQPAVCTSPPTLAWNAPLSSSSTASVASTDTLGITFGYTDCHGRFVHDETVLLEVWDQANPDYPLASYTYGNQIVIDDAAHTYHQDFRPLDFGVLGGTHLLLKAYFQNNLVGQAQVDVH